MGISEVFKVFQESSRRKDDFRSVPGSMTGVPGSFRGFQCVYGD